MEIDIYSQMLKRILINLEITLKAIPPNRVSKIIREFHKASGVRVTIIALDGRAVYESSHFILAKDNHAKSPEIKLLTDSNFSKIIRYSKSLKQDMLYIAKVSNGYILRVAYPLSEIDKALFKLWLKALIFFSLILFGIFIFSLYLNSKIQKETRVLISFLQTLLDKRYNQVIPPLKCCKEFAQIRDMLQRVSKKLAKRERQKIKYTKRLKSLTKSQSDIISAISHEFKNPVSAIMGYAQTLKDEKDIPQKTKERFLEKIYSNAKKISNMIDRLALAIKLENETLSLKRSKFYLEDSAKTVSEILLQKYPDRLIKLKCSKDLIEADRDMIEQVLFNLVENALKYSKDEVIIHCNSKFLEVVDKGEGIEDKDIEKITKKFYKLNGYNWNNSIGVGLYIVKYILKLHNTQLEIFSTPSKGSIFRFSLKELSPKE